MNSTSSIRVPNSSAPPSSCETAPTQGPLVDTFGRVFDYLRIAVNETCNLRCVYCMPAEGLDFKTGSALLSADEIVRMVRIGASIGIRKVRFTGGEPTLRRDLLGIVEATASTRGIESVHLTTNGLLLARQAAALRAAGLTGINISIDSLDPAKYERISRRPAVDAALAGLFAACEAGFPSIKINAVALRGINDDEIGQFVELTRDHPIGVRFIELMPFDSHQIWKTGKFLSASAICELIRQAFPTIETAAGSSTEHHCFRVPNYAGNVAVIPAFTRSLCRGCDRIRLTADGKIRNCLYARTEFDLKPLLRGDADDTEIVAQLRDAVWQKARDGWVAQRDETDAPLTGETRDSMGQIGG